jgi:hypothetical protein
VRVRVRGRGRGRGRVRGSIVEIAGDRRCHCVLTAVARERKLRQPHPNTSGMRTLKEKRI